MTCSGGSEMIFVEFCYICRHIAGPATAAGMKGTEAPPATPALAEKRRGNDAITAKVG